MAEQIVTLGRSDERAAAVRGQATAGPSQIAQRRPEAKATSRLRFGLDEHLLGWLFLRPDLLSELDAEMIRQQAPPLAPDDLEGAENRALLSNLLALDLTDETATAADRLAALPEVLRERGRAIVAEVQRKPALTDEKLIKDLGDTILRLRQRNLQRQVQQVEYLIRESQGDQASEQERALHELMLVYTAQKRQIQKLLNTRSMIGALSQRKSAATMGERMSD